MFTYHYLFTLVLKSPDGEWPITYTFTFTFTNSSSRILVSAVSAFHALSYLRSLNSSPKQRGVLISHPFLRSSCFGKVNVMNSLHASGRAIRSVKRTVKGVINEAGLGQSI